MTTIYCQHRDEGHPHRRGHVIAEVSGCEVSIPGYRVLAHDGESTLGYTTVGPELQHLDDPEDIVPWVQVSCRKCDRSYNVASHEPSYPGTWFAVGPGVWAALAEH